MAFSERRGEQRFIITRRDEENEVSVETVSERERWEKRIGL